LAESPITAQDRMHLVEQIGRQEPARPRTLDPRIPRDLETILMKAIEKDPRRRYPSAEALAGDLRRFLADEPIQARRIGPLERLGRWGRRNPLVAGLSAAVVLVAALGFMGVLGQWQVAVANELQAKENAKQAEKERDEVRALNDRLQRTLYVSNMNLAQHTWEAAGGAERTRELLEQHRPKPGESDLRNFEWYYLYRLCHAELLTLRGATSDPLGVAYSPDGKRLVSFNGGGPEPRELKVWDAQTGQELFTLQGRLDYTMSPDGKRLASLSAGQPGEVKVWDAQTGQELLTFKGPNTAVQNGLAFSPDGKRLASATGRSEGEVKVWDTQTGQELLAFKGIGHFLAFSPDGKRLASGAGQLGQPGEVKMWDAQTGQELLTFKGGGAQWVAFSPDSKRLASRDRKQVKVWDAETGRELLTLQGHTGEVNTIAFSPDSKRLASASWDNTVKV
jgi:DNA-binding beta-propeller fold protein YncE